jgi:hypothetical protein
LREAARHRPEDLDDLVLARLKKECEDLLRSPILRPWAQDILNATTLANATSRVLARKICGSEAGLEMDVQVCSTEPCRRGCLRRHSNSTFARVRVVYPYFLWKIGAREIVFLLLLFLMPKERHK